MNTARKGRAYEWKVKHELEAQGFKVLRMASSKGEFDLVAYDEKDRIIQLIQCKNSKDWTDSRKRLHTRRLQERFSSQWTVEAKFL